MTEAIAAICRRIGELHAETLDDYNRRFCRERGIPFTEADIDELRALDRETNRFLFEPRARASA